jgi:small basic protein
MASRDPTSLIDKLVGLCFSLLVGAAAIYIAVQLIEAVWTALLVMLGVGLFIGLAVLVHRSRSRGGW